MGHLNSARPRASSHSQRPFAPRSRRAHSSGHTGPVTMFPSSRNVRFQALRSFPEKEHPSGDIFPLGERGLFPPSVENLAAPRPGVGDREGDQQERRLPFRGHPGPRPLPSAPQRVRAAPELWDRGQAGLGLLARRPINSVRAGGLRRDRPREAG